MYRPSFTALLLCLLLVVSLGKSAELLEPPVVLPTKRGNTKVTLTVRPSRVSVPLEWSGKRKVSFRYTGRFYEMDGSGPMLPGPTLKVEPGGKIVVNLVNGLGNEEAEEASMLMNSFHGPNTTNMHFHGTHSSPQKDDPFTVIPPGGQHVYKIPLPRDHEPGLHWYHPHSHGSTYYQLMGGMLGAIDVGEAEFMTSKVHPFRGWDSRVLMIHLYRLGASSRCDGLSMAAMDRAMNSLIPSNPEFVDADGKTYGMPADLYLVNGQHRPTVTVRRGHPMLLRMAFAAGSCFVNMTLPSECDFHETAVDGVQLPRTRRVMNGYLYFTTATRRGLAAVCQKEGIFPVHHAGDPTDVLFYIHSKKAKRGDKLQVRFPVTLPRFSPDYLYLRGNKQLYRDISLSQVDLPSPRPYYVLGQGTNCSSLKNSSTCIHVPFPGRLGNDLRSYHGFMVPLHSVITATLYGDPTDVRPHPFHFHVNHFQVLSFEPRVGGYHENDTLEMYGVRRGEFRDTIPILDGITRVRWQAASYTGEVVYHCHALHHEDRGMMLSYLVYSPLDDNGRAVANMLEQPPRSGAVGQHSSHVYGLLFVFLLATALGIALRLMWRRGCRRVTDAHQASDSRTEEGSANERIPLVPKTSYVL